ncbi:MAG TPA: VCBS repeat-containing protein, partial [Planctomycetota bacterium]|nr:VCBS repeat-containing protein [Planctomycetota bacterium]
MRVMIPILCAAASVLPAVAQQTLVYTLTGDSAGDGLGRSAVAVDDLDGDGVRDLAVGSPGDDVRQVRIFSGKTGAFLFALKGQTPGDGYGTSVAAVGDVDGDGLTELAVAAPGGDYVELVSLPTQTRLWTWSGGVTQVSRAGDVDADGTLDVLALQSGGGSSALVAISGASGASGLTLNFA